MSERRGAMNSIWSPRRRMLERRDSRKSVTDVPGLNLEKLLLANLSLANLVDEFLRDRLSMEASWMRMCAWSRVVGA